MSIRVAQMDDLLGVKENNLWSLPENYQVSVSLIDG